MQNLRTRSALVAGVIALAIGIGAGMIFASQQAGAAFAQGSETEFVGVVETLPATGTVGTWHVSGRTIYVNEQTAIDLEGQALAPGLRVEVEGYTQPDGTSVAEQLEVREADDDDGGPLATGDDDDGPAAPPAPGAPFVSQDDDDGGPATSQGGNGNPTVPNTVPAAKDDDD